MRAWTLGLVAALIAAWCASAILADPAAAQGPGSEFCEQYPDAPGCNVGPTGTTGTTGTTGVEGPTEGAEGPTADAGAGAGDELPFTGYPLTALILLLLVLLLLGLALRAYLAVRDRVAGDRTAGS